MSRLVRWLLAGTKIKFDEVNLMPIRTHFKTLSGSGQTRIHIVDESHCFLEEVEDHSRTAPISPAAEAAAAVAVSHVGVRCLQGSRL